MCSAMAANVFDDQILRHILSFVPGSSELAPKYSLQPETGHYLVKAGWPVVLKKMCHWKEADTTICICCGANQEPGDPNESDDSWTSQQVSAGWAKVMTVTIPHFRHHHMKYIKKTVRSIEYVWRTMAAERCYICGHCNDCVVNLEYEHPADWLEDLCSQRCWNLGRVRGGAQIKIDRSSRIAAVVKAANMPHLQHHGTDLCLEAACGSWKACVPSGTWN